MNEKVTVKWSKKEKDWQSKYPEWENRNARIVGNAFFTMIMQYEKFMGMGEVGAIYKNFRDYLDKAGFDPNSFTISVKAKQTLK